MYNYQINNQINYPYNQSPQSLPTLIAQIGKQVYLPDATRNYCIFNWGLVDKIVKQREVAIPFVLGKLQTAQDEKTISEGVYIIDRMIDAGVQGIDKTYPVLSRFNNTASPSVQALLAGVYRKTQVPDAFGPLMKMLIRDSLQPNSAYFDPTEEIGGAILDYIRNKGALKSYQANAG